MHIDELMLIDGARVDGQARIEVRNPAAPKEVVGTIVRGTPSDVGQAIAAAKAAQPAWAAKTFTDRAQMLENALSRLESGIDARAAVFVRENGKPLADAKDELLGVMKRQRQALAYAPVLDDSRQMEAPNGRSYIFNRPFGVVVSIVPWNAPVSLAFTQIVAALLAGNCVVLKPPETCPLALTQAAAMFAGALPSGTLNIITGLPSEIGDVLTSHPDVGKIGFTGSIAAARHIMASAASTVKAASFELGGNDAAIILDDADLGPATVKAMLAATFKMTGQICMSIKRIYVAAERYQEFLTSFCDEVDALCIGNGLKPNVTMGPLHTQAAKAKIQGLLDDALRRGAHVRMLGKIDDEADFHQGFFLKPMVVTEINDDASLMTEEQFGPIVPVVVYDDVDEAIIRANQTVYGLSGSVWGRDHDRAFALARRIEAGQVWVNSHGPGAVNHRAPYGGIKQSGTGRKSGIEGILEYTQTQTITTFVR